MIYKDLKFVEAKIERKLERFVRWGYKPKFNVFAEFGGRPNCVNTIKEAMFWVDAYLKKTRFTQLKIWAPDFIPGEYWQTIAEVNRCDRGWDYIKTGWIIVRLEK